jgi:hypothetical protein
MLRVPLVASTGRPGYRFRLLVALVVFAGCGKERIDIYKEGPRPTSL